MAEINIQEHFKVPEGYFDNLAEQVMNSLPEQPFQPMKVAKQHRIIPMWTRYAAAACVAGVVIVSAFTAFNSGTDQTKQQSPLTAVTTTIADSSKDVVEKIVPSDVKEKPILAKTEVTSVHSNVAVKADAKTETDDIQTSKAETKKHVSSEKQSYDVNVNTGYDQNDVERAAMYMGIDDQDINEMIYEGI